MLSEKQRKRIVEAIQNPKNSEKTLKTILENSDFNNEFDLSQYYRDLSDDEIKLEDRMNALYANISERLYGELKQLPPEKMAELAEKWDIKGGLDKTGYLDPMFETDVLMISAGGNEAIWDAIAQLYREGYLTPPEKLEARKIRNSLRKSLRYQGALCIDNVARLKESGCNLSENKNMKKFDYREYIQDNWLLKEGNAVSEGKDSAVENLNEYVEEFWEDHLEGTPEDLSVTADEIVQLSETAVENYRDESDEDFEEDMYIVFSDESYFAGEKLTLWGAGPGGEEVTLSFIGEDIAVTDEMSKKVLTLLKRALSKGWYYVE